LTVFWQESFSLPVRGRGKETAEQETSFVDPALVRGERERHTKWIHRTKETQHRYAERWLAGERGQQHTRRIGAKTNISWVKTLLISEEMVEKGHFCALAHPAGLYLVICHG